MEQYRHLKEFDNHKAIIQLYDDQSGLRGFIALHSGNDTTPSFGATRLWHYANEEDALKDALRLSKMMSYKAALAGLKYGGGKGVIIAPAQSEINERQKLLSSYVEKVNELNSAFITGSDVGISKNDVAFMKERSPYIVGITTDPTHYTAMGIFAGIRSTLDTVFKTDTLRGRSIAIQGVGKIGSAILALTYHQAKEIIIADVDSSAIARIKQIFPNVTVASRDTIHKSPVDIFAPCAMANAINTRTVSELNCKIIAGGANNQLESKETGKALFERGIVYAPDYVINAGGLISVVDEYEHKQADDVRITERVTHIADILDTIFTKSKKENRPTNEIADEIAAEIIARRK